MAPSRLNTALPSYTVSFNYLSITFSPGTCFYFFFYYYYYYYYMNIQNNLYQLCSSSHSLDPGSNNSKVGNRAVNMHIDQTSGQYWF